MPLTPEAAAKIMSDIARQAAQDPAWGRLSPQFQRYIDEHYDALFAKHRDVIAVPCDTATPHRPDRAGP